MGSISCSSGKAVCGLSVLLVIYITVRGMMSSIPVIRNTNLGNNTWRL